MSDTTATIATAAPRLPAPGISYEAALEKVMGLADFERSVRSPGHSAFHLQRISLLMERLGDPHLQVPTVHIAGTKGKGSTAALVTSILTAQGYTAGLYTSPHLHRAVERIRVGMDPISPQDFAALVERMWPMVEQVGREGGYGEVTTFEMLTAMAFLYYRLIGADFQVIEVGLGGRLDSTNVVRPQVCAITSISLDHVSVLGDTVARIAGEKAGIIKPGAPVVVAPQSQEALEVFRRVAAERGAPLVYVGERLSWRKGQADFHGQSFQVTGLRGQYELWTPLLGDYQLENASTAIAAAETLADRGFAISGESIVRGVRDVCWPGRLEVLEHNGRLVIVDGAHNPYSMARLVQALRESFRFRRAIVIFGALSGHSASGMVAELAPLSPLVVAVRSRHPRAAPSDAIAALVAQHGFQLLHQSDSVAEATRRALEMADEGDLVLGTGSLSVVAEVREHLKGIAPELYPYIRRPADTSARSDRR